MRHYGLSEGFGRDTRQGGGRADQAKRKSCYKEARSVSPRLEHGTSIALRLSSTGKASHIRLGPQRALSYSHVARDDPIHGDSWLQPG